ncbi:RecD-like DNA helicase N-terminal domain protein [Candidatus Cyrtobacter comes]|uniref:RecD-like DNA helicase N-terminal domain protein n=1 Tax=Candidatus Cyrtobacter comes TaxID=675776 RepID=A0ABU5L9V8_9RICK|nr:RecD-like DNA helicase N-terminal domain protein [Candidatus Cyrtobacter comes]
MIEVEGIGALRAKKITGSFQEQKVVREIMIFLQSHGVGTSRATRIYKTYGNDAIEKVSKNPYDLARDIRGIGFLSADKIAQNLGIGLNSMIRARAGINYALMETLNDGHTGYPVNDLLNKAEKLLEIETETLQDALNAEVKAEFIIIDEISEKTMCIPCRVLRLRETDSFKS